MWILMSWLPCMDFSFAESVAVDQYLVSGSSSFLNDSTGFKSNTYLTRGWEKQPVDL